MVVTVYAPSTPAAPQQFTVESHSTPGPFNTVWPFLGLGGHCTCPDYQHRGGPCEQIRPCRAEAARLAAAIAVGLTVAEDSGREPQPQRPVPEMNAILFGEVA